jgi:hypothetical protein
MFPCQTPIAIEHIERAKAYIRNATDAQAHVTLVERLFRDSLESPLEVVFATWWVAMGWFMSSPIKLDEQVEVACLNGPYRIDFVVRCTDRWLLEAAAAHGLAWRPMAIEVDGHAFHERTLEQVTRRNQRDRDLQDAGYDVRHVSYEELTSQPEQTVSELFSAAQNQMADLAMAIDRIRERG